MTNSSRTKLAGARLIIRATLLLFLPWLNVQPLVDADYDDEVAVNPRFSQRPVADRKKWKLEYADAIRQRTSVLRGGLIKSFLTLLFAIALGLIILTIWTPSPATKAWLGVLSAFCFAWATLARLGRHGTSIGGNTTVERLDLKILWFLYWLGMLVGTFALF